MKKLIKKIFRWIFAEELFKLKEEIGNSVYVRNSLEFQLKKAKSVLGSLDVSVDVHENQRSSSWAVISIQGRKSDYIKFVELGNAEVYEISSFLSRFERRSNIKIDASPRATQFLKFDK